MNVCLIVLKCPYDQIFDIPEYLAKFKAITKYRAHVLGHLFL